MDDIETPIKKSFWEKFKNKWVLIGIGTGVLIIGGGVAAWMMFGSGARPIEFATDGDGQRTIDQENAIAAGKQLSGGQCEGEGMPYKLSALPMKPEDFSMIVPYGIMIGGHVTPVDHQYFSPAVFNSPKDTYPVYAMADSKIVSFEAHPPENGSNGRIRMVFSITCTFFYYYDLVTSVEPKINEKDLPIDVKAGELIGHIGGQTLDFAVWDTTKPLTGFIVPEHYAAESWKIYTADPLNYYTDDVKAAALSKYVRTVEPRSGKIDYDIDGKLIGNWFEEGTNGYGGNVGEGNGSYWLGQLAFAPDWYDPTAFYVSVGYLATPDGAPINQFLVQRGSTDPATVGIDSGLIKYELDDHWSWIKADGTMWDNMSYTSGVTVKPNANIHYGCALVQLTEPRKLMFELFQGKDCSDVTGFTSAAKIYTR